MNTLAAANETMKLVVMKTDGKTVDSLYDLYQHPTLGMAHLVDMHTRMSVNGFPRDKADRFLGWMQAAIVAWDIGLTQKDMADINRKHQ